VIFKFTKKKVVLDCFTYDELVMQTAPIAPAMKYIPNWWRQLDNTYIPDKTFFPTATMKTCAGMVDYYKKSIALPLWSDLCVEVSNNNYKWQFSDRETPAIIHDIRKQATGFAENHGHMKIMSPWAFKTKEDLYWTWSQPIYNLEESVMGIKVLPGVVNYYRQVSTHINLIVPLSHPKKFMFSQGQALVHLTPMCDRKVDIVRHLVSRNEYERIATQQQKGITFTNIYNTIFQQKQKFLDCPYRKEQ